jgi:hypothetical protein
LDRAATTVLTGAPTPDSGVTDDGRGFSSPGCSLPATIADKLEAIVGATTVSPDPDLFNSLDLPKCDVEPAGRPSAVGAAGEPPVASV